MARLRVFMLCQQDFQLLKLVLILWRESDHPMETGFSSQGELRTRASHCKGKISIHVFCIQTFHLMEARLLLLRQDFHRMDAEYPSYHAFAAKFT